MTSRTPLGDSVSDAVFDNKEILATLFLKVAHAYIHGCVSNQLLLSLFEGSQHHHLPRYIILICLLSPKVS